MNSGLIWTPKSTTDVLPTIRDVPELLGAAITERLHPRGEDIWHGQQGSTPYCVAYSWLHWYAAHHRTDEPFMRPGRFYRAAQEEGDRRGDGASLVDGRMVMGEHVGAFARLTTPDEVQLALLASGPVLMASTWTTQMIGEEMRPTGEVLGAHGYLLDGYENGRARVKNSLSRGVQWMDLSALDELRWEAWLALPPV